MEYTYPPVSFFFDVSFANSKDGDMDNRFQSVSGLSVDMQTETLKEGGENRFEHTLPVRTKYSPLVLKRGLVKNSTMSQWFMDAILKFDIKPMNLQVRLLNFRPTSGNNSSARSEPLVIWNLINAWPKKWSVSEFDAEKNSLAIESLELNYSYFQIQDRSMVSTLLMPANS